eukprot:1453473-Karenia_brevis.AAC.1
MRAPSWIERQGGCFRPCWLKCDPTWIDFQEAIYEESVWLNSEMTSYSSLGARFFEMKSEFIGNR